MEALSITNLYGVVDLMKKNLYKVIGFNNLQIILMFLFSK
jgi:hypothetical protein